MSPLLCLGRHTSSRLPQSYEIPRNSCLLKVLYCMPILSIIPIIIVNPGLSVRTVSNLAGTKQLEKVDDKETLEKFIHVKNSYLTAACVRFVLETALCIAGIALGILPIAVGVIAGAICLSFLKSAVYQIKSNHQILETLKNSDHVSLPLVIY